MANKVKDMKKQLLKGGSNIDIELNNQQKNFLQRMLDLS